MFIPLNHKNLDVYKAAHEMLLECYKITAQLLPQEEKYVSLITSKKGFFIS